MGLRVADPALLLEAYRLRKLALVEVEDDEDRLLGEEPIAAQEELLVVGQFEGAERPALGEMRLEPLQELLLTQRLVALGL